MRDRGPRIHFEREGDPDIGHVADARRLGRDARGGARHPMRVLSNRGNSAILVVPGSVGLPPELASNSDRGDLIAIDGDDPAGRAFTVTCAGPEGLFPLAGPFPATQVFGTCLWGVDGGLAEARFDWIRGTTLSLWAAQIRVNAQITGTASRALRVRAHVGEYPSGGGGLAPQLTVATPVIIPPATATVAIPAFAHSVRFTTAPATTLVVTFLDDAGASVGVFTVVPSGLGLWQALPLPIPNEARSVTVAPPAITSTVRLIFGLRL